MIYYSFMNWFKKISVLVALPLLLAGCGANLQTFKNDSFSISYPQEWIAATNDPNSIFTASHANRTLRRVDGIMMVQTQPTSETNLANLIAANSASLQASAVNQNIQTDNVKVANQDTTLWKYERIGSDNKKALFRQTMVLVKGVVYTITATIEDSVTNVSDVEAAVKSFTVAL